MKTARPVVCLLITLAWLQTAFGDGCVLKKFGVYVPEREQHAFIEWADGKERLFVATRTDSSAEPTLWVLPIPAVPADVAAEPVERFPRVAYERRVVTGARDVFAGAFMRAVVLDTGLLPFGVVFYTMGAKHARDVEVHSHVEKLGMVVEVLSAKSSDALDRYLAEKQLGVQAGNIAALEPYVKKEYALVCAWTVKADAERPARALRIDFPAPVVFYPLQPTRVYQSAVETTVYVRGWFAPENDAAGFACRYVRGRVVEEDLDKTLGGEEGRDRRVRAFLGADIIDAGAEERLTRVELSPLPSDWLEDVRLRPGSPRAVEIADWLQEAEPWLKWGIPAGLGAFLGLFLTLAVVPARLRGTKDYVWFALTGAAICLSIYVSALLFFFWIRLRGIAGQPSVSHGAKVGLAVVAIALVVTVVGIVSASNEARFAEALGPVAIAAGVIVLFGLPAALVFLAKGTGRKGLWLLLFAACHLAIIGLLCGGLSHGLSGYE